MDVPLTKRAVRYQYGVALIVSMAAMTSGAWLSWASAAIIPLREGTECCKVTASEVQTMVALMDLGNALTPIPTSYMMDIVGRKYTLFSTAFMYIIASILCFVANNVWYLYLARLSAGLAKGVAFAVVPIYLGEVANVQIRGALSTMFIGFLNLGMLYDFFFGWFLSYTGLNIANAIIPIIFSITFIFVPESPYYLTMKHKEKEALASLAKYRQVGIDSESLIREHGIVKESVEKSMQNKSRFWDVAGTKTNRRALLIISALAIFQRLSGISPTLAYMTVTMPKTGGGLGIKEYLVAFSVILVIANYVATPLIETWGRKNLLIYSAISSAIAQGTAGLYYMFQNQGWEVDAWNWVPYACLIVFGVTYSLGIGFIPSTLVGELFPQNVKSYASSISAILLAVTSFTINRIFKEVDTEYMYFFFAIACAACAIFCFFLVFETKGKNFLEIQEELEKATRSNSPA